MQLLLIITFFSVFMLFMLLRANFKLHANSIQSVRSTSSVHQKMPKYFSEALLSKDLIPFSSFLPSVRGILAVYFYLPKRRRRFVRFEMSLWIININLTFLQTDTQSQLCTATPVSVFVQCHISFQLFAFVSRHVYLIEVFCR